jgi:hypothetical protein
MEALTKQAREMVITPNYPKNNPNFPRESQVYPKFPKLYPKLSQIIQGIWVIIATLFVTTYPLDLPRIQGENYWLQRPIAPSL